MTAPSWQDLFDVGRYTLQSRRPSLLVNVGDVTDGFVAGVATIGSALLGYAAGKFLANFLDGAFGNDLTELARDRGVERDPGDYAVGLATFSRPTAAAGGGTIPAGTRIATEQDSTGAFITYTTDADIVFGGAQLTGSVTFSATKIGKAGNVEIAAVNRILDTPFDRTFTVSNDTDRTAGGDEAESDEDLRDRVRTWYQTLVRGTIDAIAYGARQTPGAGVKRVTVYVNPATGEIVVYVSDADGNSNAAMVALVTAELLKWVGADDLYNVIGATIFNQSIDISLTVRAGVDVATLADRVRNAVVARVNRLQPGDTLYRDIIQSAARDVDREAIVSVTVNTPAANIAPSTNQIIRAAIGTTTIS